MGGGLVTALVMIASLLAFVAWQGLATFRVRPVVRIATADGKVQMGEVERVERREGAPGRRLLRTGNFELTGEHYAWIDDAAVVREDLPPWALVLERTEWGRFYGLPTAFLVGGERVAEGAEGAWQGYREHHGEVRARWQRRRRLETGEIGRVNRRVEQARLDARAAEQEHGPGSA